MALTKTPIELSSTPSIVDGGNATAITIDSSENVLVGKTSLAIANEGVVFEKGGAAEFTTDAARVMRLNRTSSDGSVLEINKDGTTIGSIGVEASDNFYIADAATNTGINFKGFINPVNSTGTTRDAAIDLGNSGGRFKDIYLSGGVYLGGTAAANYLEDYETGSWTPTDGGTANASISLISAKYTKIGRLVNITMYVTVAATSTEVFAIGGLPFPSVSSNTYAVSPINHNTTAGTPLIRVSPSSTLMYGKNFDNTNVSFASLNNSIAITSITYLTTE